MTGNRGSKYKRAFFEYAYLILATVYESVKKRLLRVLYECPCSAHLTAFPVKFLQVFNFIVVVFLVTFLMAASGVFWDGNKH